MLTDFTHSHPTTLGPLPAAVDSNNYAFTQNIYLHRVERGVKAKLLPGQQQVIPKKRDFQQLDAPQTREEYFKTYDPMGGWGTALFFSSIMGFCLFKMTVAWLHKKSGQWRNQGYFERALMKIGIKNPIKCCRGDPDDMADLEEERADKRERKLKKKNRPLPQSATKPDQILGETEPTVAINIPNNNNSNTSSAPTNPVSYSYGGRQDDTTININQDIPLLREPTDSTDDCEAYSPQFHDFKSRSTPPKSRGEIDIKIIEPTPAVTPLTNTRTIGGAMQHGIPTTARLNHNHNASGLMIAQCTKSQCGIHCATDTDNVKCEKSIGGIEPPHKLEIQMRQPNQRVCLSVQKQHSLGDNSSDRLQSQASSSDIVYLTPSNNSSATAATARPTPICNVNNNASNGPSPTKPKQTRDTVVEVHKSYRSIDYAEDIGEGAVRVPPDSILQFTHIDRSLTRNDEVTQQILNSLPDIGRRQSMPPSVKVQLSNNRPVIHPAPTPGASSVKKKQSRTKTKKVGELKSSASVERETQF